MTRDFGAESRKSPKNSGSLPMWRNYCTEPTTPEIDQEVSLMLAVGQPPHENAHLGPEANADVLVRYD